MASNGWASRKPERSKDRARKKAEKAPVMVMSTPDDNLIPASDTLYTAGRYSAEHLEFPGIGHDLMLDEGWQGPGRAMIEWLDQTLPADGQPAVAGSSA